MNIEPKLLHSELLGQESSHIHWLSDKVGIHRDMVNAYKKMQEPMTVLLYFSDPTRRMRLQLLAHCPCDRHLHKINTPFNAVAR